MSSDEKIRAWKDPEYRSDSYDVDHPSGDIRLTEAGGGNDEYGITIDVWCATVSISLGVTDVLSCIGDCGNTWYQGTCVIVGLSGCCTVQFGCPNV